MSIVTCEFNSVNGENTGSVTRSGMGKSYPSTGTLLKKNCPGGKFQIDTSDGGTNNYYRLVNPQSYKGITGSKVYVWISTTYLKYPSPSSLKSNTATTNNSNLSDLSTSTIQNNASKVTIENNKSSSYSQDLDNKIYDMLNSFNLQDEFKTNTRIFGTPFQFTNETDYRPFVNQDLNYGRKYLENIVAEAPVVYLTPGLPEYMPDADKNVKESMDSFIKARSSGTGVSNEAMESILSTELRYYDFVSAYAEYMRYVNLLCRVCAKYMGLDGTNPSTGKKYTVPGTTTSYVEYDWGKWTNLNYSTPDADDTNLGKNKGIFESFGTAMSEAFSKIKDDIFGDYKYLKIYVDPSSSFSESGSNSSQQSQIAGLFDTLEGIVKEVGFFSNGSGILDGALSGLTSTASSSAEAITSTLDANTSAGLSKVIGQASHVIQGSNVIFPELWGDSSYSKSYSFTINLISPYGDPESVYLNVIVPMMHLLALSMPRQTSANSFGSPFLVKAFCKGWFSCDLGIVDSIRIEKEPTSWNVYGLPNEVKVYMDIRDLYSNLMVSKSSAPQLFFTNQGLIEFLAVTCGVNISQGNIALKIQTIISTFSNTLFDIPSNAYDNIVQGIRKSIEPWYKITNF